jgi:hypothetical protein
MVEADHIATQTPAPNQAQRQSMSRAVRVLAMQAAKRAVKRAIQARAIFKIGCKTLALAGLLQQCLTRNLVPCEPPEPQGGK